MNQKDFDFIQVEGLVDHRPFIVPGLLRWMQAVADPVHIRFLRDFPGVEGAEGVPFSEDTLPVLYKEGDQWMQAQHKFCTVMFNFAPSAISGFFTNETGIGCMMRFSGKARSVFVPFAAMLTTICPKGVAMSNILGYDTHISRGLISHITPGMMQAMQGTVQPDPATPSPVSDTDSRAKTRPSYLKRIQ